MPDRMYCTYAYITASTRSDDVSFHVSKRYSSKQLWKYMQAVVQRAALHGVIILEFYVHQDDGKEIWRGRF